ncbi:glycosyltransferase family 2 protein [Sphingobacterium tabacisoli]|uniref:Glycosyltransferase family 2 protein n=1 Tax=Sphingobacterium tabacisoli TaxID=2044855 RepID=A0ABW5LAJ9_9SPHI|nr:glycosyltransferase family 2 protein [Sphingobacterium tabacisoli]
MKQFDVSIIIPFYNVENYIVRCAHSLFQQSLERIQFIFVNDSSTDNSLLKLNDVIAQYPFRKEDILIVNHAKNRGSAAARNTGLDHVSGEYTGWVDADDWIERDMYEQMLAKTKEEGVDMVWCDFYLEYEDSSVKVTNKVPNKSSVYIGEMIKANVQGMLWNKLFRSEVFTKYEIRFIEGLCLGEDRLVVLKYLHYATRISYLDSFLYHYVQYNEISIVKDSSDKRFYEEIGNAQLIDEFIKSVGINYISEEDMNDFKIRSKRRLLLSTSIVDLKNWRIMLPEVNRKVFKTKELRFRHKVIAYMSEFNSLFFLQFWLFLKGRFGETTVRVKK